MRVELYNHRYFITEVGDENYNVTVERQFRTAPFLGMKQPTPFGAFLGMDTVLRVYYKGRPATSHTFTLSRDGVIIQNGVLDHEGAYYALKITMNDKCECIPFDCVKNEHRLCDQELDLFEISLTEPEEGPSFESQRILALLCYSRLSKSENGHG